MTERLPSSESVDPIAHGRQLRSNYLYNVDWVPFDVSDLWSLLWRYDQAHADGQTALAAYYRAGWEALLKALGLHKAELGQWLLRAQPPIMASLPAFVEREAPFAEDLLARAEVVETLFGLRAALLAFGADEVGFFGPVTPGEGLRDERLRRAVDALYLQTLPAHLDSFGALLTDVDNLLHELLLAWQPRHSETLSNLITHYGFPDPGEYRRRFKF